GRRPTLRPPRRRRAAPPDSGMRSRRTARRSGPSLRRRTRTPRPPGARPPARWARICWQPYVRPATGAVACTRPTGGYEQSSIDRRAYAPGMDPTVVGALIGTGGTVIVAVAGFLANVRNTSATTAASQRAVEVSQQAVAATQRTVEVTEQ